MPTLYIIAGPNGVGKTTFADSYLPDEAKQVEFVNADLIARGLSPYGPDLVAFDAGKIALRRIRELIVRRTGFTWETTMSGRSAVAWLREARAAGYFLKAYFLWVGDPEVTLRRVRQRVAEGGHNIAEDVSRRRFFKTLQNFLTIYRPLIDSWKLYDNDLPAPRLLAVGKAGRLVVRDQRQWSEILEAAKIDL
jgi:predicted ABC-type ATPase